MKRLLLALCAVWLSSCADVEFTPYEGAQRQWAVAPGGLVERGYSLPVYRGAPPRAYRVLGMIEVSNVGGYTQERSAVKDAITEAKKQGADAVVLMTKGRDAVGSYETGMVRGIGFAHHKLITRGSATVVAIKWR